jgi:DNA-binding winged helix-turn-helix (wHTH) protein
MSVNFDTDTNTLDAPSFLAPVGRGDVLIVGGWRVEPDKNQLTRGYQIRSLQPRLMDLLVYLFEHRSRVVSRDEILENIWTSPHVTPHALSNAISKLRSSLGDSSDDQTFIVTKRGFGYQLVAISEKLLIPESNLPATAVRLKSWTSKNYVRFSLTIFAAASLGILALLIYGPVQIVREITNVVGDLELGGWSVELSDEEKPTEHE